MSSIMWTDRAACRTMPTGMFVFGEPRRGRPRPTPSERVALAVCATCSVITECLDDELDTMANTSGGLTYGVRGGTIPPERYEILQRRRALRHIDLGRPA